MKKHYQIKSVWVLVFLLMILEVVSIGTVVAHEVNSLKYTDDFKVEITDVRLVSQTGQAIILKDPFYASSSIVIGVQLMGPGDSITYEVTVSNIGDNDVYLNDLYIRLNNYVEGPIKFTVSNVKTGSTELHQYLENKIIIEAIYDENYTGVVDDTNNHITAMVNLIYQPM